MIVYDSGGQGLSGLTEFRTTDKLVLWKEERGREMDYSSNINPTVLHIFPIKSFFT